MVTMCYFVIKNI